MRSQAGSVIPNWRSAAKHGDEPYKDGRPDAASLTSQRDGLTQSRVSLVSAAKLRASMSLSVLDVS
jgi:hypothetical protein